MLIRCNTRVLYKSETERMTETIYVRNAVNVLTEETTIL